MDPRQKKNGKRKGRNGKCFVCLKIDHLPQTDFFEIVFGDNFLLHVTILEFHIEEWESPEQQRNISLTLCFETNTPCFKVFPHETHGSLENLYWQRCRWPFLIGWTFPLCSFKDWYFVLTLFFNWQSSKNIPTHPMIYFSLQSDQSPKHYIHLQQLRPLFLKVQDPVSPHPSKSLPTPGLSAVWVTPKSSRMKEWIAHSRETTQ